MRLGVNIDHVATLRQARYGGLPDAHNVEPDLAVAAAVCEHGGANGITLHLRADRRHIQDRDVYRLRETINTKLNLEMGNTPEIVDIALKVLPEEVCIVPENRKEITTEGGLDVSGQMKQLEPTVRRLQLAGIRVSLFIEPAPDQIEAAAKLRVEMVELHTGAFANAQGKDQAGELMRLKGAADHAHGFNLQVNAGHGINYTNIASLRSLPYLAELNIGHSIVCRGVIVGLAQAVAEMLALMNAGA
ncbi:MAG: pyridoxine 5-phosphate synthase [Chthoniobacter sp.]|jgi:pyridoxine 5-phosphate synthase|nr:pyridoxine 5-phosphate synthase [Chthoniobacter sp.]